MTWLLIVLYIVDASPAYTTLPNTGSHKFFDQVRR